MTGRGASGTFKIIALELVVVVVAGLLFSLTANQLSPRGLALNRNYFPGSVPAPATPAASHPLSEGEQAAQRLREKGLQAIDQKQVEQLFRDPRYQEGLFVFVDAREEDHYNESHIPGAYSLNPYHPEKNLGAVLPVCQTADKVVVYCNGGDCEDSESTALLLRQAGVPAGKLFIYSGGFPEWQASHLPVETGADNRGAK